MLDVLLILYNIIWIFVEFWYNVIKYEYGILQGFCMGDKMSL